MNHSSQLRHPLLIGGLLVASSVVVFYRYGLNGALNPDCAIYMYSGQQMAHGVAPYLSIFDVKGPGAPVIMGIVAIVADQIGVDALYLTRLVFAAFGCLCPPLMFFLGRFLFKSNITGLVAAMTILSFSEFTFDAMSGPRPKVPLITLVLLSLITTCHRRWFWAGVSGSLAAMIWQPTAVYGLATLVLAFTSNSEQRARNMGLTICGFLLPAIPICAYFFWKGSFGTMLDQAFFHALFTPRDTTDTIGQWLARVHGSLYYGFRTMSIPMLLSVGFIVTAYGWRVSRSGSLMNALLRDRFAPLLLTFPAPLLWSVVDFQWYPDLYIFLPYISLAFAKLLMMAIEQLAGDWTDRRRRFAAMALTMWLCVALWLLSLANAGLRSTQRLLTQKRIVEAVMEEYGHNKKIFTLGCPQVMVILERTQHEPFLRVNNWIAGYMNKHWPGGFDGWLEQIGDYDPDIIFIGRVFPDEYGQRPLRWVEQNYTLRQSQEFRVYTRKIP